MGGLGRPLGGPGGAVGCRLQTLSVQNSQLVIPTVSSSEVVISLQGNKVEQLVFSSQTDYLLLDYFLFRFPLSVHVLSMDSPWTVHGLSMDWP